MSLDVTVPPSLSTIPTELVRRIFARLSLRHVMRFKRLCRFVRDVLSEHSFAVLHLGHFVRTIQHDSVKNFLFSNDGIINEADQLDWMWFCLPPNYQSAYAEIRWSANVSALSFWIDGAGTLLDHFGDNVRPVVPVASSLAPGLILLQVHGLGLCRTIPDLSDFKKLVNVDLSKNRLEGSIPASLGCLFQLKELNLSSNALSGRIPIELTTLTKLKSLVLNSNRLAGRIPASISNLKDLQVLDFGCNQLSGPLIPSIGLLANLTVLNLRENNFGEPIPPEIGALSNLRVLDLSSNCFSGSLPDALGQLACLEDLLLFDNNLSGAILQALGIGCVNLQQMLLMSNVSLTMNSEERCRGSWPIYHCRRYS
ncbi:hypothetical protein BC830DRAFT_1154791 [Chytriomyces sp. MP71]|nr:hypothetical protein BC830DRAFT_1154791 [Chytriomyces sp. MP71]